MFPSHSHRYKFLIFNVQREYATGYETEYETEYATGYETEYETDS